MRKLHILAEALEPRRLFSAGSTDATFNLTGRNNFGSGIQFDSASAVARQPDGKYLVAGLTSSNTTGRTGFAVARLNTDGSLDTSFGTTGLVTPDFGVGANAQAAGVGVTTNGKVIVGGFVSRNNAADLALVRLNADGSPDTSYGTGGTVILDANFGTESVSSFLIDTADNVYLGGTTGGVAARFLVARITPAGTLDTTWGGAAAGGGIAGVALAQLPGGSGSAQSLALAPGGRLVAGGFRETALTAGGSTTDFAVARFNTDGTLDTSFATSAFTGSGGVFINDFAGLGLADEALAVAVQSDGRILAAGFSGNSLPREGASRFAMLRLNTDGTLDPSFANAGKFVSAPATNLFQSLGAVGLLADGSIVAAGTQGDPGAPAATPDAINADFALIKLTSAGVLDTSFGTGGVATADLTGNFDEARSLLVLPDGRVVLAGLAGNASQQGGGADFGVVRFLTAADSDNPGQNPVIASVFGPAPTAQGQPVVFTVTLALPATSAVGVSFATADGTGIGAAVAGQDYAATTGTLTFAPGQQQLTVSVPTLANTTNTTGRSFSLGLTAPAGASNLTFSTASAGATVLGTVQVAPLPVVSVNNVSASEPTGTNVAAATFTVTLSATSTQDVSLVFSTADAAAIAGADYTGTAGTLTIPAGSTTATISVPVLADAAQEPNETFVLNLTSPVNVTLGSSNQGIATILDASSPATVLPVVSVAPNAISAERLSGRGVASFTVSLPSAAVAPVTVIYSTTNGTAEAGSDYVGVTNGTLTIPVGATSGIIDITTLGDAIAEGDQTFTLALSSPTGATIGNATATLLDAVFHTVAFSGRTRAIYTDADGQRVTVSISGRGTGVLVFPGAAPAIAPVRGVLQEARDADSLYLTGTTATSRVTLSTPRTSNTSLNFVSLASPLSALSGTTTDLRGDLAGGQRLTTLTLRSVQNALLLLGNGANTTVAVAGAFTGSTLTTTAGLRSFRVGNLAASTIDAAGPISSFFTRGAVTDSVVRSAGSITSFTASSLVRSRVLSAVAVNTAALPVVGTAATVFSNPAARIDRLSLTSRADGAFSDSLVIAPAIRSASLGRLALGIAPVDQGLAADTFRTVTFRDPSFARTTTLRNPQGDNTRGDFTVRNV